MVSSPITLAQAIEGIHPADAGAMRRAEARQATLTKPPAAWGGWRRYRSGWRGFTARNGRPSAARRSSWPRPDHGVVAQGVTGYPQAVTAQMVLNFLAGGAAISVMCRRLGIRQVIVDAGVVSELPPHPELLGQAHRAGDGRHQSGAGDVGGAGGAVAGGGDQSGGGGD